MSAAQQAKDATRKLLAGLWDKNLPVVQERLALLQRAAASAEAGTLTAEQRKEAGSVAHKLAGSLGMFGYPKGTDTARLLEQSFDSGQPLEGTGLLGQVAALRGEVGL